MKPEVHKIASETIIALKQKRVVLRLLKEQ